MSFLSLLDAKSYGIGSTEIKKTFMKNQSLEMINTQLPKPDNSEK